ncbi:MAG: hypothetical protein LYZ69_01275 [Nitrososphaerales archaeon]|nr:hypothetical protein [Nitrososphaerales archaeon]
MSAIDELTQLLSGGARVVVIAQRDVDLTSLAAENTLLLLKLTEGSHAAGGRGAGFGERKVVKVSLFRYGDGACEKLFDTEDEAKVAEFEVPYYVARMPMTLRDGTESMGYGVVDPELVGQFAAKVSQLK